jgi:hypothetical protein
MHEICFAVQGKRREVGSNNNRRQKTIDDDDDDGDGILSMQMEGG